MKQWYNRRLIFPFYGVMLLCLLGTAVGISNTHVVRAASTTQRSQLANTPVLQSIRMVNQTTGWATANTTMILRTVNGGNHWSNVTPHYNVAKPQSFVATFRDAQHAWVAYEATIGNGTFTILRTMNGGASWQSSTVKTSSGFGISSLTFNGNLNGWLLVGDNGGPGAGSESFALFSTTNGGAIWSALPDIRTSDQNVRVSFVDAKNGYLTHGGPYATPHMSVTHDGGRSWQEVALPAVKGASGDNTTTSPVFFGSTGFLPVGVQGVTSGFEIFTTHNNGATWRASGSFLALGNTAGLGGVGDLYIVDPTHFYVTNQRGQSFISNDMGVSWHRFNGIVGAGFDSLSFINAQQGWAAGNGLLRTVDGDNSWQKVNYTVQ
ncbi:MAG: hypothetical protein H0V70_11670 [Ktedonobacteraceae bacterium]|nr:hypothetical protein [Ktedonobacteraceae bacterium]